MKWLEKMSMAQGVVVNMADGSDANCAMFVQLRKGGDTVKPSFFNR